MSDIIDLIPAGQKLDRLVDRVVMTIGQRDESCENSYFYSIPRKYSTESESALLVVSYLVRNGYRFVLASSAIGSKIIDNPDFVLWSACFYEGRNHLVLLSRCPYCGSRKIANDHCTGCGADLMLEQDGEGSKAETTSFPLSICRAALRAIGIAAA